MKKNKLCLGTVQFGLHYGINNKIGKPSRPEVFRMLDEALDKGIRYIDTATAYGDAEEILGEYIASRKGIAGLKVISKLRPNLIAEDEPKAAGIVEREVVSSLRRLNIDALDGYLLHTPANLYNQGIIEGLVNCRSKGLINNLGISIYDSQQALDAAASGVVDYIQIPYSVFDQRLNKTDFFKLTRQNNVTVFARSAFLQGLILMDTEEIPVHLAVAKEYLKELDVILRKYSISRLAAALWFSLNNPDLDYIVFGVDNFDQLTEDLILAEKIVDFEECYQELYNHFLNVEQSIVIPSLWAKKE